MTGWRPGSLLPTSGLGFSGGGETLSSVRCGGAEGPCPGSLDPLPHSCAARLPLAVLQSPVGASGSVSPGEGRAGPGGTLGPHPLLPGGLTACFWAFHPLPLASLFQNVLRSLLHCDCCVRARMESDESDLAADAPGRSRSPVYVFVTHFLCLACFTLQYIVSIAPCHFILQHTV